MSLTVEDLSNSIARLKLLSDAELLQARSAVRTEAPGEFLDYLVRRQMLTDFQADRLKGGEHDILVVGGCKLLYRNASGSFARLYRACSMSDGSMVGIKLLRERWAKDADFVRLFHREGEIGQKLKHPNIVPIYRCGTDREFHYLAMEFVEGGNLRDFLKIRKKLVPLEACKYALQLAGALEYALRFGFTHRDLKPTNVLMSSTGIVKLIDFGLAADDSLLNRAGTDLQQAVEYSTLEKGSGAPTNDPRSDLFFLGTILYEMLTGQKPYASTKDREERKRFGRYRDIPFVTSIDRHIPPDVATVVDNLLQINPAMRYQTPGLVVAALQKAIVSLGGPSGAADAASSEGGAESSGARSPTVLIVENRPKQQDMLRDYLSNRGYRVLMLSDVDRAMSRLKNQPPDCLVLVGEVVGDRIVSDFKTAADDLLATKPAVVALLSEKQVGLQDGLSPNSARTQVLVQPVTLRELRRRIQQSLEARS